MLVLLSGVSGAGKDTIKKELIKRMDNVESLPSFTDRSPREGEKDGQAYHFISTEKFKEMIDNGELYEYDVHHNHYYGTSKKLMNEKIKSGKIIVKDIDVNGTEELVKILKNDVKVITIFLRVPMDELKRRLILRDANISKEEIELRLNRFEYEESKTDIYDYVITDSEVEMEFARKLEQGEVTIYAKLPNGFKIRTPFGNYNPDWALVFDNKDIKYIYFIAETKGSMQSAQLKGAEKGKIECARKHFKSISDGSVKYGVVDSYEHLIDMVTTIDK